MSNNTQDAHAVVNILSTHLLWEDYPVKLVRALEEVVEDFYEVERDHYGCYNLVNE